MKLSKRQQEIQRENRAAAGLPVLVCPNCGAADAHWVADHLDEYGLVIPGYYICEEVHA
jgi:hypothetical protein